MAEKSFKFISPGVFINEIDQSQLPEDQTEVGPLIIGRSRRGPAMRPVRVTSLDQFVQTFGEPVPGFSTSDPWRDGNFAGPTYGQYAAQAWLANSDSCTFVRLLGTEHDEKSAAGRAGWSAGAVGTAMSAGGAYGLLVFPSGTVDNSNPGSALANLTTNPVTGTLAAVWYLPDGGKVALSGSIRGAAAGGVHNVGNFNGADGKTQVTGSAVLIESTGGSGLNNEFKVLIEDKDGTNVESEVFNFNRNSPNFIRKVFNTDPTLTNSSVTDSSDSGFRSYWLGESYEEFLREDDSAPPLKSANDWHGVIVGLACGTHFEQSNYNQAYKAGSTGWFISQHLSTETGSYVASQMPKLFKLNNRSGGEYDQGRYKISITDIKYASNPSVDPYGTFTLRIRKMQDADHKVKDIEAYTNLSLDKNSPNFIGRRIGDKRVEWDSSTGRNIEVGEYPNVSEIVWVEMAPEMKNPIPEWLPFGVFGPKRLKKFGLMGGRDDTHSLHTLNAAGDVLGSTAVALTAGTMWVSADDDIVDSAAGQGSVPSQATLTVNQNNINGQVITLTPEGGAAITLTCGVGQDFEQGGVGETTLTATRIAAAINTKTDKFTATSLANVVTVSRHTGAAGDSATATIDAGDVTIVDFGDAQAGVNHNFLAGANGFTGSVVAPRLQLRRDTLSGSLASPKDAYFGVYTDDENGVFDKSVLDHVKARPAGVTDDSGFLEDSYVFSLDDVCYFSGSNVNQEPYVLGWTTSEAMWGPETLSVYEIGNIAPASKTKNAPGRVNGQSITADFQTFVNNVEDVTSKSPSYKHVLDAGYDSFTTVMAGGFDGWDVTEKEPLRGLNYGSNLSSINNSGYNTVKRAIDICKEPTDVEYNIASVPGVINPGITSHLLTICEERADALAVIDLEQGYIPEAQSALAESSRKGSLAQTVSSLQNRYINNSYGCSYYPWVKIFDTLSGQNVWVPPSVVAIGAMSKTDADRAPWFAPAGFTRGGLSAGAAGLPVVDVIQKLTTKDRDTLYDNNINPISSFPSEGIVIFGQKTLQVERSALDRINVRRMLIQVKRDISAIAKELLFEPNVQATWDRFINQAEPLLDDVQARFGIDEYKLVLDETTTTPDLIDRNTIYAKLFLKPTRAVEFFLIDFIISNSGASFTD